jgi:hypothetical protein
MYCYSCQFFVKTETGKHFSENSQYKISRKPIRWWKSGYMLTTR